MCSKKKEEGNKNSSSVNRDVVEINIDKLDADNMISFSSVFKSFRLLPLETNENCLIGQIDQLEIVDDTLYVLDISIAKALFMFSIKGVFIRKIGKIGKGPGEYINPLSFTVDAKNRQIQILDRKKILKFNSEGELVGEIILKEEDSPKYIANHNGITYIDHSTHFRRKSNYLISSMNESGKITHMELSYQSFIKNLTIPINTSNQLYKTDTDIKYVKPFMDAIYSIDNNNIIPYISFSTQNRITENDIRKMNSKKDPFELFNSYWECEKFLGARDYIETPRLIMFKYQNRRNTHTLFYWKKNKSIFCTKYPVTDDLTQTKGYLRFYSNYNNYFISSIDNNGKKLERLVDNIKNKKIELSDGELTKLTPNCNPVIVLYECREAMKNDNEPKE